MNRFRFATLIALTVGLLSCTSPDDEGGDGGGGGGGGGGPSVADTALNGIYFKLEGREYALGNASVYRFSPANRRELNTTYEGTATRSTS